MLSSQTTEKFTPADVIKVVSLPRVRIDLYSHGIRVSRYDGEIRSFLIQFCVRNLSEEGLERRPGGRMQSVIKRIYVGTNTRRTYFQFHRNQYKQLVEMLVREGVAPHRIETIEHAMYEPAKGEFPLVDARPPREKQLVLVDYLLAPCDPRYAPSKVVTLQTGAGKTFLSLYVTRKIGQRTVLIIPGKYMDQWIEKVIESYGKRKGSLMTLRGMPQVRSALNMGLAGEMRADFIIMSTTTYAIYLREYEKHGVCDLCPVDPVDFFKVLGAGVRIIDEVHELFHTNFRCDTYSHVPLTISLSATLEPDSKAIEKMYNIVWPPGTWAPQLEHHRYIAVSSLWYRFESLKGLRWMGAMGYSHSELEKSIMRNKRVLENYIAMIVGITEHAYISKREPGQKCLIFVATIALATILTDQLASLHRDLDVRRYVSEDDFENLNSGDIVVSTLQSAGTAVDIVNLRTTIMTTARSSKQSNQQALGRTRPLVDWPDVTPEFLFLACSDIDKHCQYALEKKDKFDGKVLSFSDRPTGYVV